MTFTLQVPNEYGYVVLAATGTFLLSTWHGMRIGRFRKAAGIGYPTQYATNEQMAAATSAESKQAMYLFNCAQRAHYNFLENHLIFLAPMMIGGLRYPLTAAVTGVAWSVFRIMYAVGYTRADQTNGKGRLVGSGFWLCQLLVTGLAGTVGVKML